MASAFAMMTWEIMLEGFSLAPEGMFEEISMTTGAVQFNNVSDAALLYYEEMAGALYVADSSDGLIAYTHPLLQDQVGVIPSPSVLALFGLASMMRSRRRN